MPPAPTPHAPLARSAMAYVLAGGRGSRLLELTDKRAKPAVFFGGTARIIDFALSNALNSGIRRIGVATQYKAHSLIRHLQRGWTFLRPERNESFDILPASQRVSEIRVVRGNGRRRIPEHRHHRKLRPAVHRVAGGRPCLQDGLRTDAAAARRRKRRRDGRLHRGAARRGDWLRRDARGRAGQVDFISRKTRRPAGDAGQAGHGARQHGHLCLRNAFPLRPASSRCRRSHFQPRFRQGSHPLHRAEWQGGGAPVLSLLRKDQRGSGGVLARCGDGGRLLGGEHRSDRHLARIGSLRP